MSGSLSHAVAPSRDRLTAATLPTASEEIWRYSRIDELDLTGYQPVEVRTVVDDPDGFVVTSRPGDSSGAATDLFGGEAPDVFAGLNRDFVADLGSVTVVQVPDGAIGHGTLMVTHHVGSGAGEGFSAAVFPRLVIDAGANSEVTVIERFVSDDDGVALVVPVLQLRAGQAARVNYLAINELNLKTWQIGNQQAVGDRDSQTTLATVSLGGDYARVRTELAGSAARAHRLEQVALYFAGGNQMHDFRTIQDHDAPHTNSDLLFKGAVQDHAASVYTGLIKIREHARGTAAFQTNRNLTLSEGAWAESVPNLDIETNDVKCSHASTVGPIDEEQRFYLESRGVRPEIAERLVVLGFFDEVLAQLPAGDLADELRSRVAAKLDIGSTPTERPATGPRSGAGHERLGVVFALADIEPGTARKVDVDGVAASRRPDRRRRLRDRRHLQPRRHVAVRGRGVVRRTRARVPEARQRLQSRHRRAEHAAGDAAGRRCSTRPSSTARSSSRSPSRGGVVMSTLEIRGLRASVGRQRDPARASTSRCRRARSTP